MKKIVLLFSLAMLFVLTIPVAAQYYQPVGDQMNIGNAPSECVLFSEEPPNESGELVWDANAPFYIAHGWNLAHVPQQFGFQPSTFGQEKHGYFQLILDGEIQKPTARWRHTVIDGEYHNWLDIYEFKDGLTGVHEFQGRWVFQVCSWNFIPVQDCDDVREMFTFAYCSVEVTFTE